MKIIVSMEIIKSAIIFSPLLLLCHLPCYEAAEPLIISIFYEALCEDCVRLFQQLPKLLQDEEIMKKVHFDLVPYGKTELIGGEIFSCQHGVDECFLNKIHGCARRNLNYIDSLDFMVCMMATCDNQYRCLFKECTLGGRIDTSKLLKCAVENGNEILKDMRELSKYQEVKEFVPTVVFNKYYRSNLQSRAMVNLKDTILQLLNEKGDDEIHYD